MKTLVETTHALSLPGVMGHLYWAVFLEKSFHAKSPSRRGKEDVFLSDSASLREKNHFMQSRVGAKGGYAQISGISPHIFPQLLT
jgi:hypothetical protein